MPSPEENAHKEDAPDDQEQRQSSRPEEKLITRQGLIRGAGTVIFLAASENLLKQSGFIHSEKDFFTIDPVGQEQNSKEAGWKYIKKHKNQTKSYIDMGAAALGGVLFVGPTLKRRQKTTHEKQEE